MKNMMLFKRRAFVLTLFILTLNCFFAGAQPKVNQHKVLRVLLIGNSFSQNATAYLPQLVKEGGYELQLGHAEIGGCPLQKHWELAALAATNPNDPAGKPYGGKSLKQLLADGKWHVVTMQQYSKLSADINTYQPYIDSLYHLIKTMQPSAKIVWHQTWAYRRDAISFGLINATETAKNDGEMYEKSAANYHAMAKKLHAGLIPTGAAFWDMRNDSQWGFIPDSKATIDACIYPALPPQKYSINMGYSWDKDKKLTFDPNHANAAGKYLGALVWYHYLFNADLSKVTFKPAEVDEALAKRLKLAVATVFKQKLAVY